VVSAARPTCAAPRLTSGMPRYPRLSTALVRGLVAPTAHFDVRASAHERWRPTGPWRPREAAVVASGANSHGLACARWLCIISNAGAVAILMSNVGVAHSERTVAAQACSAFNAAATHPGVPAHKRGSR